jgi:hypothetical protein
MLNIEKIRENRNRIKEPEIVEEIRQKILNTFNDLTFLPEPHKYFRNIDGIEIEHIPVTKLIENFEPYVDWETVTKNYADKLNLTVEDVKRDWHYKNIKGTNAGTGVHLYGESWHYFLTDKLDEIDDIIKPQLQDGYLLPHSPKEEAIMHFNEDLFEVEDMFPVLAETRVYSGVNPNLPKFITDYAGTFDELYYYHNKVDEEKSGLIIFDYKTNIDLYNEYNRRHNKCLLYPFENLINENKSVYTGQLSLYQIPLEDIGFKVLGRRIIWVKPDGTYEKLKLDDVSSTMRDYLTKNGIVNHC